jgi:hypothetical protein
LPPRASTQKLGYLIAAALLVGIALDLSRTPRPLVWAGLVLLPPAALVWLAWPRLAGGAWGASGLMLVVLALAAVALLLRLEQAAAHGADGGRTAAVILLVASLGLGGTAVYGASALMAQLAFGLAAATGGFLLWNWPKPRLQFGVAGLLGAGGGFVLIAAVLVLYSRASVAALGLILLAFLADSPARRLKLGAGVVAGAVQPVVLAALAAVPVAAAVAVAGVVAGGGLRY